MKMKAIRIIMALTYAALLVGCGGDNGSGSAIVDPLPAASTLIGIYSGQVEDVSTHVSAYLEVDIFSVDSISGIKGTMTMNGIPSCFSQGSFSGSYDAASKTVNIQALDNHSGSTAVLSFNHSANFRQLFINEGVSRIETPGNPCFVPDTSILTKREPRSPRT